MNILPLSQGADKAYDPGRGDFFVQFESAGIVMAVEYVFVREVVAYQQPVPVPHTPAYLTGVINYNGQVCPVVSISAADGSIEKEVSGKTCILMVEPPEDSRILIGLIAEQFFGSVKIPPGRIAGDFIHASPLFEGCFAGSLRINNIETAVFRPFDFLKKLDFISINN